jgi:hypothetical protein
MASSAPEQHLRDVPASLVLAGSYIILGEHDAANVTFIVLSLMQAPPATEGGTPAGFEQPASSTVRSATRRIKEPSRAEAVRRAILRRARDGGRRMGGKRQS